MKIKNIELVAERIKQSVVKNEQLVIFGDSDLDGVSSVVILKETIDNLRAILPLTQKENYPEIMVCFPDRQNEGYGLNQTALDFIKSKVKGGLLITLDCGITNYDEIKDAKAYGFDVIIVDHHMPVGGILPIADIVMDPKQPGDDFLFKEYCNAGLAFKLSEEILKDKMSSMLRESLLELTAMATISDMMIEEDENISFIFEGLLNIEYSNRPSIKTLVNLLGRENFNSKRDLISRLNAVLNSGRMEDHVAFIYLYLIQSDVSKAKEMAEELIEENENRQDEIYSLTNNLRAILSEKIGEPIIFEGSPNWSIEFLGAVASRICNYYGKPTFIYQKYEEFSRGTVRVPKGYDAVKAMESCGLLLRTFGGHPPAAGFTVINENIDQFKQCLIKYFNKINLEQQSK
ncbi:MAG: DHH family phosphoesterase [Candidatus Paceibacterota bacterium]|jgi:single-stranded-DNA-specific exonuclease